MFDSVHGGGVSASVHAGIPPHTPGEQTPLGADTQTPPEQTHPPGADTTSPRSRHTPPRSRHPLGADTTWRRACWEIRSTCGWYASYWNAILLNVPMCQCANTNVCIVLNVLMCQCADTNDCILCSAYVSICLSTCNLINCVDVPTYLAA